MTSLVPFALCYVIFFNVVLLVKIHGILSHLRGFSRGVNPQPIIIVINSAQSIKLQIT